MPESEHLKVRIFVCHNALTERATGIGLRELGVRHGQAARPRGTRASCPSHVEQLPCLGKIDPRYLLRAFEEGCDAICLIGCPIAGCRTMDGNLRAQKRVAFVRGILDEIGIQGERLFLFFREPMDEKGFLEVVGEFLAAVEKLGPSELTIGEGRRRIGEL